MVESQTDNLTLGPSFGHNLCFKCPNEQCEPILDIYVPRAFQWYKERHKTLSFDPSNCSLKFWESTQTPSLTHSQVPGWTHLRVHKNVVAKSWDSEGAPGFQL
jgi:hypothetical protein